jgi:carboxyl-terminal processing protease
MARFRDAGPLLLALALALALGFGLARGLSATDDLRGQLDLFTQVLLLVQNNYVETPDNEKLVHGAIDGMLRTLDPHTVYVPEQRAEQMDEQFQGEYSGIGISFEIRDGYLTVIAPLEGTPSYRLGIRAGDRIVAIDGNKLPSSITNEDVFRKLRGPSGSMVHVTIEREGEDAPLEFDIERAKIPIESIPYAYMIRPGVGYVRVVRFSQTTGDELDQALETLKGQGMKSLVLDLRYNSGGLLSQAVEVLDEFLPPGRRLVYTRGRIPSANADYFSSERAKPLDGPIVVLIDHQSASASEIVAGALQDLDRALVAGTTSFGKGLVQNQMRLQDGSKLLLTIAKYYTPSGRLIQRDYTKFADQHDYAEDAFKEDVPQDSVLAHRPKFKTAAGRAVYGGGGIMPDVVLKDPPNFTRPQVDMIQKRVFFEFATHYVATHKDASKMSPETFEQQFTLGPEDWDQLGALLKKREIASADSLLQADREFIRQRVEMELAGNLFGPRESYRIQAEADPQLQAALELFPKANDLLALSSGQKSPAKPGKPDRSSEAVRR